MTFFLTQPRAMELLRITGCICELENVLLSEKIFNSKNIIHNLISNFNHRKLEICKLN
jgi:hypothetical protein